VTGPRGSGKRSLIEDVVASDTKNVLTIDCDEICKTARTDTKLVSVRPTYFGLFYTDASDSSNSRLLWDTGLNL
jgi:hypothetical protein